MTRERSYLSVIAVFFASVAGIGYAPVLAGTAVTAAAVVLVWALSVWPLWAHVAMVLGIAAIAFWAVPVADEHWGDHDSNRIVIDELAGFLAAAAVIDRGDWVLLGLAFAVYRLLVALRPPPLRWFGDHLTGALGIILDDVAAGVLTAAIVGGLTYTSAPDHIRAWLGMG